MKTVNELTVRIVNPLQVYKYMVQGVNPLEVVLDEVNQKIVFVFAKEDTRELYTKWKNREL